jgi:cytochrome c-type biogenesis protein CcmH/NrfF
MKRSRISTVALFFLILPAISLKAQEPPKLDEPVQAHPEGDAAIASLKSPFCPGLMLEVCPSPQAKMLRDTLQLMAQGGVSSDSLVSWMLANFGKEYRAVPQARGSGLWAWLMPPLALLVGLFSVVVALRHFRARPDVDPPVVEPLSEEDESVLAAALRELKAAEEIPF